MSTRLGVLNGLLARVHDVPREGQPGAAKAEVDGAVAELVRRIRRYHEDGETDLWLAVITREERDAIESHRKKGRPAEGAAPEGQPARRRRGSTAADVDAFIDILGAVAGVAKRRGLFDEDEEEPRR